MKTSVKILLLILCSIGAVGGVLIYLKTRVAPPSNMELSDQYAANLKSSFAAFDAIDDFEDSRAEYIRMDDMLIRYLSENDIDAKLSDEYRTKIDETYGRNLISYGFGFFQNSVWPDNQLREMLSMIESLKSDVLSTGEYAVNDDFIASADQINDIVDDYWTALRLSKSTSFKNVDDALSKIERARDYMDVDFLKNNAALVSALEQLPERIAKSHLRYIENEVNRLNNYENMTQNDFHELLNNVNSLIDEYNNTYIYGDKKPSIDSLNAKTASILSEASAYYKALEDGYYYNNGYSEY